MPILSYSCPMQKLCYNFFLLVFSFFFLLKADFALAETNPAVSPNQSYQDVSLKIGGSSFSLTQKEIDTLVKENLSLAYSPKYLSEIENNNFCENLKSIPCSLLFGFRNSYHIKKISQKTINEKGLSDFLNDLERRANKEPENAKLKFENGKVTLFSPGGKGVHLDKEKSFSILKDFLQQDLKKNILNLAWTEIEPEISLNSIDNMGITSLIGEGRSNFKGSPKNRIYNINVATNRFNGIIIKPGEEFSFVKILGDVDKEHGYLPELVIKKDKTEPEFGGGICQVSTTAFRAAIYSGLKITARRNHAYPVQYYNPQGMDSTIYIPRPDLKFINNTVGYILIQTKIEGTELIFDFYGTPEGKKINIIGPTITEKNPDGSMKTTFTQQVFGPDEKLIFEDVFNSSYDSPSKYPHPGQALTQKPANWSAKEWQIYKKANNIP
jgi:vancomycin resistance protein YoaR